MEACVRGKEHWMDIGMNTQRLKLLANKLLIMSSMTQEIFAGMFRVVQRSHDAEQTESHLKACTFHGQTTSIPTVFRTDLHGDYRRCHVIKQTCSEDFRTCPSAGWGSRQAQISRISTTGITSSKHVNDHNLWTVPHSDESCRGAVAFTIERLQRVAGSQHAKTVCDITV